MAPQPPRVRLPRITHPADHPLITVRQAADLLGCSDMTIYRRISARRFPAVCMGRKAMVPRAFVEGLLRRAAAGATVIVDEAVEEWATHVEAMAAQARAQAVEAGGEAVPAAGTPPRAAAHMLRTQMSLGGIAARRGSASDAPGEEMSTPLHGSGGWKW